MRIFLQLITNALCESSTEFHDKEEFLLKWQHSWELRAGKGRKRMEEKNVAEQHTGRKAGKHTMVIKILVALNAATMAELCS